jgi:hypothetical protein
VVWLLYGQHHNSLTLKSAPWGRGVLQAMHLDFVARYVVMHSLAHQFSERLPSSSMLGQFTGRDHKYTLEHSLAKLALHYTADQTVSNVAPRTPDNILSCTDLPQLSSADRLDVRITIDRPFCSVMHKQRRRHA